jgi:hypothetical protein
MAVKQYLTKLHKIKRSSEQENQHDLAHTCTSTQMQTKCTVDWIITFTSLPVIIFELHISLHLFQLLTLTLISDPAVVLVSADQPRVAPISVQKKCSWTDWSYRKYLMVLLGLDSPMGHQDKGHCKNSKARFPSIDGGGAVTFFHTG